MSHPYKTRSGGATVTIFVPYDCRNHCPFCINKKEYADCTGFSVEAILRSIAVMDAITPECDFVFTGGEPFAQLGDLQRMLDVIPGDAQGVYQHHVPRAARLQRGGDDRLHPPQRG